MTSTASDEPLPEGDIYRAISYASLPFAQSEPARLFGFARMFGLAVPDASRMRVLEIGCASGGNLIPLAARYPEARFLGVDLAPRHVTEAQARIASAGLANIEIRQGDIGAFDSGGEKFDAVICHGVYSWVPPDIQQAILRITADCLAETGVAYVSYNVYPGWHHRCIIRDLMQFHLGSTGVGGTVERIAEARRIIASFARLAPVDGPYGGKIREEAGTLAAQSDAYILGEFLAPFNAPCHFAEFHAAAEAAGLAFLCEAEPETSRPETHGEEVGQLIRTMSQDKLVRMEQCIDLLIGRQFRQTLLVRGQQASRIEREPTASRVADLPVHGRLLHMPDRSRGESFVYRTPENRTVTTRSVIVHYALEGLAAAFPETRTVRELEVGLEEFRITVGLGDRAAIADVVLEMLANGLVRPSSVPIRVGRDDTARPLAFALARADAEAGRDTTASLQHEPVTIDALDRVLLPLLDGTRDRRELRTALTRAVVERRITATDGASHVPPAGAALRRAAEEQVELRLQRLAEVALLVPHPAR